MSVDYTDAGSVVLDSTTFDVLRCFPRVGRIFEDIIEALYRRTVTYYAALVDGGANSGGHTVPMARVAAGGIVHAYEPVPILASALADTLKAEGVQTCHDAHGTGVRLVEAALSQEVGESEFNFVNAPTSDPRFPLETAAFSGLKVTRPQLSRQIIRVKTTTLDCEIDMKRKIEFIKLDLEGGEYHALVGARNILSKHRPIVVLEDGGPYVGKVYGYSGSSLPDLWAEMGYQTRYITGHLASREDWMSRSDPVNWRPFYTVAVPEEYDIGWLLQRFADEALVKRGAPTFFR